MKSKFSISRRSSAHLTEFNSAPPQSLKIKFGGLTLFLFMFSFFLPGISDGQTSNVLISGDNFFRDYNFGIYYHYFKITTDCIDGQSIKIIETPYCPNYSYSDYIKINNPGTTDLTVLPYTWNDQSDYLNGVSTADIQEILKHILGIQFITDPYKLIAADVNMSSTITAADIQEIRRVILGYEDRFTRTSWEWVNKRQVEDNPSDFAANPYNYVVNAIPGGQGIFFDNVPYLNLTTPGLFHQYFDYRATKIGEIIKTIPNNWVCGTYLFTDPIFSQSRSLNQDYVKLDKGEICKISIELDSSESVVGIELPIYIDQEKLKIINIHKQDIQDIDYHYNVKNNRLTIVGIKENLSPFRLKNNSVIIEFTIEAIAEVANIKEALNWDESRNVELFDSESNPLFLNPRLVVKKINNANNFNLKINNIESLDISISLNESSVIDVQIVDILGRKIYHGNHYLIAGINKLDFGTTNLLSGAYVIKVKDKNSNYILSKKFVLNTIK